MLLADSLLGSLLPDGVFFFLRIIATIGAAVVGWFVCDPLTRGGYWLVKRAATPGVLLFACKGMGSILLAVITFVLMQFVSFGPGGGGFGFGPGPGGLPGKGPGEGGDKAGAVADGSKDKTPPIKDKKSSASPSKYAVELVEVEIIKLALFKKDGKNRYYLLDRAEPARSLDELKEAFEKNKPRKVLVVRTKGSIDDIPGTPPSDTDVIPYARLEAMAKQIGIEEVQQTLR